MSSKVEELAQSCDAVVNCMLLVPGVDMREVSALLRKQDEAIRVALESMCWAARVMNINEDEAPGYFAAIAKLREVQG